MKQFIWVAATLVLALSFTSCKKERDATPLTIVGFWQGSYTPGAGDSPSAFAFLFRANGSMRAYANNVDTAKADKAEGSYLVTGSTVSATYDYGGGDKYEASAVISSDFTNLTGLWKDYGSQTFIGSFSMERK